MDVISAILGFLQKPAASGVREQPGLHISAQASVTASAELWGSCDELEGLQRNKSLLLFWLVTTALSA